MDFWNFVDFWTVGIQKVPHFNMDTQSSIESISWGIKTVVEYGCARSSRSESGLVGVAFINTRFKPLHAFDRKKIQWFCSVK